MEAPQTRQLGYIAKSADHPDYPAIINLAMSPDPGAVANAARLVNAFEAARAQGRDRVELDGHMVEMPTYLAARRLLARAEKFGAGRSETSP